MSSYIDIEPEQKRVRVTFRGEAIADTGAALALKEGAYPVVYYIPRRDVRMERLVRTTHSTHCPHKGDASYFSIQDGPANAVWSYEQPKDAVAAIREHVAFYPDKVDSIEAT
jgi:uncharacterized protein (DUF427 family)